MTLCPFCLIGDTCAEFLLCLCDLLLLGGGDGIPAAAVHFPEKPLLHSVRFAQDIAKRADHFGGGAFRHEGVVLCGKKLFGAQRVLCLLLV